MSDVGAAAERALRPGVLRLVAIKGASAGDHYETGDVPRPITIGRRPTNDLVLKDETVSREHAIVEPTAEGWRIIARKRGALLMRAGQVAPEEGVLLADGDEFQLGRAVIRVSIVPDVVEEDADRTMVLPPHAVESAPPPNLDAGPAASRSGPAGGEGARARAGDEPAASPEGNDEPDAEASRWREPRERFGRFDVFTAIHDGDAIRVDRAVEVANGGVVTLRRVRAPQLGFFARRRFLRAVGRLRQIDHPNLLAPRESGRADGELFLVYPPFRGVAADVVLRHGRRDLPIDLAVWIGQEVARGVAHTEQVLGADARVAVSDGDVVCGRDGGVALLLSPALAGVGDRYRAPEEDAGGAPDVRATIFALGVLVWELLAREPVVPGQQATLRSIDAVRIQVRPELASVVMRALEVRPEDRYGRAVELADALADELERIAPGYGPEAAARWLREHVHDEEEGER